MLAGAGAENNREFGHALQTQGAGCQTRAPSQDSQPLEARPPLHASSPPLCCPSCQHLGESCVVRHFLVVAKLQRDRSRCRRSGRRVDAPRPRPRAREQPPVLPGPRLGDRASVRAPPLAQAGHLHRGVQRAEEHARAVVPRRQRMRPEAPVAGGEGGLAVLIPETQARSDRAKVVDESGPDPANSAVSPPEPRVAGVRQHLDEAPFGAAPHEVGKQVAIGLLYGAGNTCIDNAQDKRWGAAGVEGNASLPSVRIPHGQNGSCIPCCPPAVDLLQLARLVMAHTPAPQHQPENKYMEGQGRQWGNPQGPQPAD
mmetsp:Transcript_90576/g.282031  ORF Transcript_90576/g.282031 Transcript_90576/m.282031 type:complete len:313 (-) Transcript_90576:14-952(-)